MSEKAIKDDKKEDLLSNKKSEFLLWNIREFIRHEYKVTTQKIDSYKASRPTKDKEEFYEDMIFGLAFKITQHVENHIHDYVPTNHDELTKKADVLDGTIFEEVVPGNIVRKFTSSLRSMKERNMG